MTTQSLIMSRNNLDFNSGSTNATITSTGSNGVLAIEANDNLYLRAGESGTGKIYVAYNNGSDTVLRNPNGTSWSDGATEVSSKIVKQNIKDVDEIKLNEFIENIRIAEFDYKADPNIKNISLIIEDEIDKNNPFIQELFVQRNGSVIYKNYNEIPSFLKPYVGTGYLDKMEDGSYQYNSVEFRLSTLANINTAIIQKQHKKIKELEYKYDQLLATLATVIAEVREIEDRLE